MKSSKLYALLTAVLVHAAAATAGAIDMDDPRRVVGREGDVRIDAQVLQDTITPGSPIGITYQIENLSAAPVAVADKVAAASYDSETRTVTLAVGSEVPQDGSMPLVSTIAPGEKKVFRAGATPMLTATDLHHARGGAHYVQVKVSILRNLEPFQTLIARQSGRRQPLSDELFEQWFESNDTIFLNTVPVRFSARSRNGNFVGADRRDGSAGW